MELSLEEYQQLLGDLKGLGDRQPAHGAIGGLGR